MFRLENESKWMQMAASNAHAHNRPPPPPPCICVNTFALFGGLGSFFFFFVDLFSASETISVAIGEGINFMQMYANKCDTETPSTAAPMQIVFAKQALLEGSHTSQPSPPSPHIQPSPLKLFPILPLSPLEFFPYALLFFSLHPF